ncbi:FtsK/SpoIIIE domain-containing protein [Nocardioides sp. AE5]|uniref:FtsK/SpoIIIE domain-containing protein n=1 Tax=Nocardioides sp. AE5 TaxID=2962573 RepID=UPI0028823A14|nr:FtsK/SpoIIIE domain-containing protein [Nocardioides sp. AE5]MDT0202779.1 FtsK/SpoIIIE domain-containing protein [Nocardioides sp. AE5]
MQSWALSLRATTESGVPSADVRIHARPDATVADLARELGHHLAPDQHGLLLVPTEGHHPWPADRRLAECGLRTGDLLDVVSAPRGWLTRDSVRSRPRAVLRVTEGPDRGQRVHVRGNALTIGRAGTCTLRLSDPLVSHQHARVVLGTRPTLFDEGSANGTHVAGQRLRGARELDWGTPFQVGSSTLVIDPGEVTGEEPAVSVYRSPRFGEPLAEGLLEVSAPPTRQRPSPLPWTMVLMPMVLGLAMLASSRSPYTMIYLLAWPFIGIGGWWQQRRVAERHFTEEVAAWREEVDEALTAIDDAAIAQRERTLDDHPDPETVRLRATAADPRTWSRTEERSEFLTARAGLGPVPALLRGTVKEGGDREIRRSALAEFTSRGDLDAMPVLLDLTTHALVAVTGPVEVTPGGSGSAVDDLVRALVLRLAHDHSPHDLSIAGCFGAGRAHHEAWLRWLPHAAPRVGGAPPVAVGTRAATALLDQLAVEDQSRGHTICLVDEEAGVPRRTLEAIAAQAGDRGLHLVWMGSDPDVVPAATGLLVDLAGGRVAMADRAGEISLAVPDGASLDQAWRGARAMTGYVDEAALLPASTALPRVVRLPEVSPDFADLDRVDAVLERWRQSVGLRAQIGAGVDGVVTIDLREDGPHGLVAGTTGSGKSELLQSLICSLALNNPPSRISFLLVDYKGGAAFRECADLPHTVGYITDLTPALVTRALTSLSAEIATREHLLGTYGVKDLVQLEREHPEAAPPSLLICVDEFAALTAEVPDFVDGMVNIAQRGRSLGMHVLLATQRPAGVVTGNIRANTDLRIALRVGAVDDSSDVIDSGEAARISRRTPGRAWIRRTGHGTAELVQSAWVGAREPIQDAGNPIRIEPFTALGSSEEHAASEVRLDPRTDLERCVATINSAFARTGQAPPPRPWLPALSEQLDLPVERLRDPAEGRPTGRVLLGLVDDPQSQRQPDWVLDYAVSGHLLVHGASGSGKSELLRTVALSASLGDTLGAGATAPYVYCLDFAGGGLSPLGDLPTTAAIATPAEPGRVMRMIRLLKRTVTERTQALAANGCADLDELARMGLAVPRVYLLVDNLPALVDSLESAGGLAREHVDHLQTVLQNGRRVGIHVSATAPGRGGVPSSLGSSFGRRVVLRMTTGDDYVMLGVPGNVLDTDTCPGRGLEGRSEVQVASIGGAGTPAQAEHIAAAARLLLPALATRAEAPVPAMPARLPATLLPAAQGLRFPIAVDIDAVAVIEVDLAAGPVLVAGKSRTGRTSALDGLAALAARSGPAPTVLRDRDPERLAAALAAWCERTPEGSGSTALLMVDDAHLWEGSSSTNDARAAAVASLVRAVTDRRSDLGVVVTADVAEARRAAPGGLLAAVRNSRRGFLLQPDWADGDLFGVTVPTKTVEPLAGLGRGLWCTSGTATGAQLISGAPVSEQDGSEEER